MRYPFTLLAAMLVISTTGASVGAPSPAPAPSPTAATAPGSGLLVPGGTPVDVGLSEPLSSGNAKLGDQVAIIVKKEVDENGYVVVPQGAMGHATVTTAQGAGSNGSGGKLALQIDWVYSEDGGKIPVSSTDHASENGDNKGAASTATLISWALLGPLGFFAHNFVRGHDVTIGTDKTFTVFVDHDIHVESSKKAASGGGFDH